MAQSAFKNLSPHYQAFEGVAPSGGVTAGDILALEDCIVVAMEDAEAGDPFAALVQSNKIELPMEAATGVAFAAGDKVYADVSANKVTTTASGNTLVGVACEAKAALSTSLIVNFDGKPVS